MYFFCFFFQAEDGIRDDLVTGVQTCALPISLIYLVDSAGVFHPASAEIRRRNRPGKSVANCFRMRSVARELISLPSARSEERRVGKECRSRWGTDYEKKKLQ